MDFLLPIQWPRLSPAIRHTDRLLLVGSCFTEHIGQSLGDLKWRVLQNPQGILFGPDSVCRCLQASRRNQPVTESDLFQWQDVWHSWDFHSRYSNASRAEAVRNMNASRKAAHAWLQEADWVIITLGSAFGYRLTHLADTTGSAPGDGVANCHRAPAAWFDKTLLAADAIGDLLLETLRELREFNPRLQFLFTISPVRHIRDGVVENNRSKARLIEAVHFIVQKLECAHYFPAYELVVDVLRDYRFYDADLVHPNYMATQFVLEKFIESCVADDARALLPDIRELVIAGRHKPFHPDTPAHRQFLERMGEKTRALQKRLPYTDWSAELAYFSGLSK